MPSSNKTEPYGLNIWSGGDKPKADDFTSDNQKINEVLKNTWNKDNLTVESGKWTPTLVGAEINGNVTFADKVGSYYKIGRLVYFQFRLSNMSVTTAPSGAIYIKGWPFPFSLADGTPLLSYSRIGGFSLPPGIVGISSLPDSPERMLLFYTSTGGEYSVWMDWGSSLAAISKVSFLLEASGAYLTTV